MGLQRTCERAGVPSQQNVICDRWSDDLLSIHSLLVIHPEYAFQNDERQSQNDVPPPNLNSWVTSYLPLDSGTA